jgi:L-2-hydroxyglutarate oxidase LhgO
MSAQQMTGADFVVIGGGIIGVSIALAIRGRWPDASVTLLEKEDRCGQHASGRNSGVLHGGLYYAKDSLKARFTVDGNRRLSEYCQDRNLPYDRCGKLIVTRHPRELAQLDELAQRGRANGVELHTLDEREASRIEPRARTVEKALFSPKTAVVDPVAVVDSLVSDALEMGIGIHASTRYLGRRGDVVLTDRGSISAGFVVNAAGLHADRVAHDYGFGRDYRILPFKGLYLNCSNPEEKLRVHVYPVPDPRFPFLGVHFTRTVQGGLMIGPTALPAFWREQYAGMERFRFTELMTTLMSEAQMFLTNGSGFRELAWRELPKYSKQTLFRRAGELVPDVGRVSDWSWGRPGIRAQLYHTRKRELVDDFILEGDDRSLHVLNAVSPAFTCAVPFADFVVDAIDRSPTKALPSAPTGYREPSPDDHAAARVAQLEECQ